MCTCVIKHGSYTKSMGIEKKLILHSQIRNWITLFLTLANKRKGYMNRNVTPYMHAAAYHLQDSLDKFENVKQFSGQGKTFSTTDVYRF